MIDLDSGAFAEMPTGVTVLICTYNGAATIAETLACLARQQVPAGVDWEVILVDNASTDGTAERAQEQWDDLGAPVPLRVLREPRPGKQHAVEVGVRAVRYRYACIVDDDNRLLPNYLATGLALLEKHPRIGILGGRNTATFEAPEPEWFSDFQARYAVGPQRDWTSEGRELSEGNVGQNVLWGAGMFVRTAIWKRLQAINFQSLFSGRQGEENLTAGEDDELCYLCLFMGYEVWYSPSLQLRHYMTAGRLTTAYRDQLFYGATHAMGRLGAYRNALWGKASADAGNNFIKDLLYSATGLIRGVCTLPFLKSLLKGNAIDVMNKKYVFYQIKELTLNAKKTKEYYRQAAATKEKLAPGCPA